MRSVFTDGVGHISQSLAQACASALGYRNTLVSAVQIRLEGAKGVLTVVSDDSLGENEVRLRPSMIKLSGVEERGVLNVLKVSYMPLRLFDVNYLLRLRRTQELP